MNVFVHIYKYIHKCINIKIHNYINKLEVLYNKYTHTHLLDNIISFKGQ